jgi:hypothetical protein
MGSDFNASAILRAAAMIFGLAVEGVLAKQLTDLLGELLDGLSWVVDTSQNGEDLQRQQNRLSSIYRDKHNRKNSTELNTGTARAPRAQFPDAA